MRQTARLESLDLRPDFLNCASARNALQYYPVANLNCTVAFPEYVDSNDDLRPLAARLVVAQDFKDFVEQHDYLVRLSSVSFNSSSV